MRCEQGKWSLAKKTGIVVSAVLAATVGNVPMLAGESSLSMAGVAVGYRLQSSTRIILGEAAPGDGFEIRLRSADPGRLLLANTPDQRGLPSITLRLAKGFRMSPEFWVQALATSGTVQCIAEAAGYTVGGGTVSLSPSGIALVGPYKAEKFAATTGGAPTTITFYSVRLDSAFQYVEEQAVAGGAPIDFQAISSDKLVGQVVDPRVTISAGTSHAASQFRPAGEGETTLTVLQPSGFHAPGQFASVTAAVSKPGLAISGELFVGHNLQVSGVLALGEAAPDGGVAVTLTSEDPDKLLLSLTEGAIGVKSVCIAIPAGQFSARYYLQALGDSGVVNYTATAAGFRSRTARVGLAPSGVIVTPIWQGPPDEGQVLRPGTPGADYRFLVSLANTGPLKLVVWTAQLDPTTHRSADITVQPLRAGLTIAIPLKNNNPVVGNTPEEVTIRGGTDHALADFTAFTEGTIEIAVVAPTGFTPSANSTKVVGVVHK